MLYVSIWRFYDVLKTFSTGSTSTVSIASGKPSSEITNANVYAIGQESSKVTTNSNGEFTLLIDATKSGVVLQKNRALPRHDSTQASEKKYEIIIASNTGQYGKKFEITGNDGDDITLPSPVEITEVGSISGKVTLQNKTDNTGIMVYIPGTSLYCTNRCNRQLYHKRYP